MVWNKRNRKVNIFFLISKSSQSQSQFIWSFELHNRDPMKRTEGQSAITTTSVPNNNIRKLQILPKSKYIATITPKKKEKYEQNR